MRGAPPPFTPASLPVVALAAGVPLAFPAGLELWHAGRRGNWRGAAWVVEAPADVYRQAHVGTLVFNNI